MVALVPTNHTALSNSDWQIGISRECRPYVRVRLLLLRWLTMMMWCDTPMQRGEARPREDPGEYGSPFYFRGWIQSHLAEDLQLSLLKNFKWFQGDILLTTNTIMAMFVPSDLRRISSRIRPVLPKRVSLFHSPPSFLLFIPRSRCDIRVVWPSVWQTVSY